MTKNQTQENETETEIEETVEAEDTKENTGLNVSQIAEYQSQIEELNDKVLRSAAETENIKRRAEREKADALKYGAGKLAKELLTVADNLRRALDAIPEEKRNENDTLNNLYIGVEATEKDLLRAFEKVNIRPVEALGKTFDPHFHQVVFEDEESNEPAGIITQELQKGYMIEDRLLREAMVSVSKGNAKKEA